MYPSELARLMLRSSYSMTQLIDRLEKDGFIVRDHNNKDRRIVNVRITSPGLEYVIQSLTHNDVAEKEVMSVLDNDEIERFRNTIRKLREPLMAKRGGQ